VGPTYSWQSIPNAISYRICKRIGDKNRPVFKGAATTVDLAAINAEPGSSERYRIDVKCSDGLKYQTIVPFFTIANSPEEGFPLAAEEAPDITAWRLLLRSVTKEVILDQVSASPHFLISRSALPDGKVSVRFFGWNWRAKRWQHLKRVVALKKMVTRQDRRDAAQKKLASSSVEARPLLEAASELPDGSIYRVSVGLLAVPEKSARFLSHSRPRPDFPNGVMVIGDRFKPVLHLSSDLGKSWSRLELQMDAGAVIARHFLTLEGAHIVQTNKGKTFLFDVTGRMLSAPDFGSSMWHGAWSIDQSASGVIAFSQYRQNTGGSKNMLRLWRSADGGVNWSHTLKIAARSNKAEAENRHFHTCQADPFKPGRWYMSSSGNSRDSAIQFSDDDALTWKKIPLLIENTQGMMPDAPLLHQMKAFAIRKNHLVWATDNDTTLGHAALVTLEKETWKTSVQAQFESNLIQSLVTLDDKVSVAISDSENFPRSSSFYFISDDRQVAGRIALDNLRSTKTNFNDSRSSREAICGNFFSATDGHILTRLSSGVLHWQVKSEERPSHRHYRAGDAPFATVDGVPLHWFPESFVPEPDDMLAFFHSQRTGGSSFRDLLKAIYGANCIYDMGSVSGFRPWKFLEESDLSNYRLYAAHTSYWEKFFTRRVLPISIVREPIQRIVSLYRLVRVSHDHDDIGEAARALDFEPWCREVYEKKPDYISNCQTRFICSAADAAYAIQLMSTRYFGVGTDVHRGAFQKSMARKLRWPDVQMPHKHGAPTPMDFEISVSARDFLIAINEEDYKLYDFVRRVWDSVAPGAK
jgi:hypothetical protein